MRKMLILIFILLINLFSVNASSIFLSDYLEEGQTKVYETEDGVYVVNLLSVSDEEEKAVFRLNDEMSKGIKLKDSYVFKDGSEIVLRDLIISDATERNDEAYYYFYGTGKEVLKLKNVSRHVVENKLCNFDGQCLNETKENCCYDCGCYEDEKCVNNKCVVEEKKEEIEIQEEIEEEVEEEIKKEEIKIEKEITKEKRAAYVMLVIILIFILIIIWFVLKKKRSIF